ncbi:MAG: hypothetical protein JWL65_6211 [Gammaproteobacteria bacterium]|nr:hypothetical protein [Gammaproteobacteria bacterium]
MTNNKLSGKTLTALRQLETKLLKAVRTGANERAIEIASEIQTLFGSDRRHPRLLRAKLWTFESCLDAQRLTFAESGLVGVRGLAGLKTRLHLEASSLLAVCYLRQKRVTDAKRLIREVINNIDNINSSRTRHAFQRRLIERIEEECIFVELIGSGDSQLDAEEVHSKAVLLVKGSSDDEILRLIGNSVPVAGIRLLGEVRKFSIQQLPESDQKLLPSSKISEDAKHIGKTTFAVLRRVAWKTFCNPDSAIYKMWAKRVPQVFNQGYFAAAVVSTMENSRIGIPLLASGVAALVMKYSAEEFCRVSKPKGIMIHRSDAQA